MLLISLYQADALNKLDTKVRHETLQITNAKMYVALIGRKIDKGVMMTTKT